MERGGVPWENCSPGSPGVAGGQLLFPPRPALSRISAGWHVLKLIPKCSQYQAMMLDRSLLFIPKACIESSRAARLSPLLQEQ